MSDYEQLKAAAQARLATRLQSAAAHARDGFDRTAAAMAILAAVDIPEDAAFARIAAVDRELPAIRAVVQLAIDMHGGGR
ncbi:hypothetical protein [Vulcaniibacterium tengchongense]|uniref:Uncharacterized protein n=1 Tax=Vulcaniibacterium tengchongense TaxID=1273429 RepID=A0A3N4VGF8_9GAMM|nr:hypothetical protein [Vulcaniibacterium tengchongense]RPE81818.1 hypothetical protein EDC50_1020 [Vulcaniibacterium tengchongense]